MEHLVEKVVKVLYKMNVKNSFDHVTVKLKNVWGLMSRRLRISFGIVYASCCEIWAVSDHSKR